MLQPLELRAAGGSVLIGPLAMIPAARRGMQSPLAALSRLFQDRAAVAQLRREWAKLEIGGGHHHLLSAPDMHALLERAIALHRIALLWVPSISHHAIHVTVPPKPAAPPTLPDMLPRPEAKAPPVPVGTMAIPAKVERALVQSFDYIARDGKKGLKEFVAAIDALRRDPVAMAKIVAFCALLAVPVVGEAAAGAFLAYAYYLLGFHGTLAALHFGAACVRAAAATTDAEIDAAAREFADAFEDLGEAVIAWLMTRIQPMSSVGARSAAAEKEASIVARAQAQAAKVVKQGENSPAKFLSENKLAREAAKAAAGEAKAAEAKLAEAAAAELIAARQATAKAFYEAAGWSEERIASHLQGIDFTKPVEVITLKAEEFVVQHGVPGSAVGNYFAPVGTAASELGINPAGRVATLFTTTGEVQVLRSTAAPILDTWSVAGQPFQAAGGGTQYFTQAVQMFSGVK